MISILMLGGHDSQMRLMMLLLGSLVLAGTILYLYNAISCILAFWAWPSPNINGIIIIKKMLLGIGFPTMGVPSGILCLLCGELEVTTSHLFFNCIYVRCILVAICQYQRVLGMHYGAKDAPIPSIEHGEVRVGDIIAIFQCFTKGSSCGLHWTIHGAMIWHIWSE